MKEHGKKETRSIPRPRKEFTRKAQAQAQATSTQEGLSRSYKTRRPVIGDSTAATGSQEVGMNARKTRTITKRRRPWGSQQPISNPDVPPKPPPSQKQEQHHHHQQQQQHSQQLEKNISPGIPRPVLTRPSTMRTDGVERVAEAQPREYWLGRFVTLINAFHYEDSFNEPDISTGFGMLSSYSRPLAHSHADQANYRIKRAFMVLENVCVTDEASASLREFRDEYIQKYGDQWML